MSRYKCDPRWIRVRFKGNACALQASLYCEGQDCGQAASRECSASAFEDDNNTSM